MPARQSVTVWLCMAAAGDDTAEHLWMRHFPRLVGLVRQKLAGTRRRVADEEDVTLRVFRRTSNRDRSAVRVPLHFISFHQARLHFKLGDPEMKRKATRPPGDLSRISGIA